MKAHKDTDQTNDLKPRKIERIAANQSGLFKAELNTSEGSFTFIVVDFSFEGVRLRGDDAFNMGEETAIRSISLSFGNQSIGQFQSPKIAWVREDEMALSFEVLVSSEDPRDRSNLRHDLQSSLQPQFLLSDPIFPGEKIHGSILNISISGMRINPVLGAEHLLPGMSISEVQIFSPFIASVRLKGSLRWVKSNDGRVEIGVEFHPLKPKELESLAQLILALKLFSSASEADFMSTLGSLPGLPAGIRKFFRARPLRSPLEFEKAKKIRYRAYGAAGKLEKEATADDLLDHFDSHSETYGVYLGQQMVGTFRFTYSRGDDQPYPLEKTFAPVEVKQFSRDRHVEVGRLALIPELQHTDGVIGLFDAVTREAIANQVDLYMCATDKLKKYYLRLGAKVLSEPRPHPVLPDESLTVLRIDSFNVIRGRDSSFFSWKFILKRYYDAYSKVGWIDRKTPYSLLISRALIETPVILFQRLKKKLRKKKASKK